MVGGSEAHTAFVVFESVEAGFLQFGHPHGDEDKVFRRTTNQLRLIDAVTLK